MLNFTGTQCTQARAGAALPKIGVVPGEDAFAHLAAIDAEDDILSSDEDEAEDEATSDDDDVDDSDDDDDRGGSAGGSEARSPPPAADEGEAGDGQAAAQRRPPRSQRTSDVDQAPLELHIPVQPGTSLSLEVFTLIFRKKI